MKSRLMGMGVMADDLDSIVSDAASDMASNANSGGMKSQLEFLNQNGYSDDRIWVVVLTAMLEPGMSVDVTEPKHGDSVHSCSFSGTVNELFDEFVRVRDMEDNHWDISFDEIERFGSLGSD